MPFEIRVPDLGESVLEAVVGKWLKQVGDPVSTGDVLLDLETEKVNQEVTAEQSGVLVAIARNDGATVGVGEVLGVLDTAGVAQSPSTPSAPAGNGAHAAAPVQATSAAPAQPSSVAATPVAQRMAAQSGIDLAGLHGSGPGGRITKQDVVSAQPAAPAAPAAPPAPALAPAPAPSASAATPPRPASPQREQRVRMSRRRQTIARRLVEAQQTAAMLTTFNEVDMSRIMDLRARRKDSFKERNGVNLGFMSFFTRASVGALKAFPRLNAEIQGDEIVLKQYYDIGIAVGAPEGLVVPVVRDADAKSFAQIEREIADLARRARDNTLTIPDLLGGTFTITNGGVFGSLLSTPILNAPQVGILGMHKIQQRPVALDGQVVIRPMMYLALSYDHRIVDGSEAVSFLVRIKELLEDPESLLLEG